MGNRSYFTIREWAVIILLALISALLNTYLPIRDITIHFSIPGPAAGMALFGGIIFVLWIYLAHQIIKKKYAGIITSIVIACICLFIRPWYGIMDPFWFSIYGIIALLSMGIIIKAMENRFSQSGVVGGGLGNLSCLVITWLAIGFHTGTWAPFPVWLLLVIGAFVSGSIGVLIAQGAIWLVKISKPD